jgi:ribosome-binding factor A
VLGEPSQRRLVAKALDNARGFVQRSYAKVVKTRSVPILAFAYDDAQERRASMDEIIHRARRTDPDGGALPTPPAPAPNPSLEDH